MATELIHTGQHTPRRAYSTHTLHPGRNTNTPCQGDSTSASRSGYSTHTPRRGGPRAGLASAYAVVLLAAVLTPAGTASAQSNSQPVFSIDDYTMYLLPGADGSSTAESVGAVTAADPDTGDTLAYSLRASDPSNRMYMIGGDADALYTLDSTTSTAARVGTASQFGVSETQSAGMVWHNGKLYMAGGDTDSLYTIDALTGEAILVATNAQLTGGQASSSTLSGVASHGGDLYATTLTSTTGRLYRVDLDSSTSTQIGEDDFGTVDESRPHGIASHGSPAKLYMAGADTDKLYEVDTTTGAATAVGNTDDFGVGETDPRGLASHNDSLYMIGNSNDRLYTLDTATGAAARVGNADDFGVGESAATGIASGYARPADFAIDASTGRITYTGAAAVKGAEHTLYAQVSDGNSDDGNADTAVDDIAEVTVRVVSLAPSFSADSYSYTVTSGSDGSSTPVAVGAPSAADPDGHPLDYSLRASDPSDRMYMLGGIANALYTLDSTTGTAARVGTATRFGVSEYNPSGLAWHNGRLYMTGHYTDSLYRLDTVTGEATRVATRAQITGGGGYNPIRGVASHNGELYVTTINPGRLYRVDLGTLRGTQIGTDSFGAAGEAYPFDIASHGSPAKLYMIGRSKLYLYTIDTDTGEAARVGNASYFGVDEGNPLGLASHNGSLYMTAASGNRLYTLNTTTGAAARVGNATDFGVGETAGAGIASGYVRPADFAIDASTGQITYTGASAPPGVHTLYVRVSDGLDSDGVADTAADDTARVVVTVPNRAPSFVQDSYDFNILPGTDGSSTTAPVGSAAAADPDTDDTLAYSLRASDPSDRMYMLGGTADALYTLDSATSTATRVGTASQFGISETGPRGMAWHNGKLYMVGHSTDSLHTLDTVTGEATRVATRTQITGSGGPDRVLSGVASHNGDLYVTTTTTGGLYRVDLDSSTGTQIGPDGFGSVDENAIYAIASHGSPAKLYMIGAGTGSGKFYTVDTTTGIATRVGSAYNFGVNESVPLGLASHGGSLYMTGLFTVQLFTVDTSTGVATRVGDATAFGAGESGAGIASGYEKPPAFAIAPSTGAIAYSGGAAAAGAEYTLYAQVSDGRTPDDESGGSIDATAPVTVRVKNTAPAFARSSYDFALTPGSDGSVNAITIGTTAAADPDTGDTLAYSLRSSDPPNRMYMLGGTAAALYALDSTTSNAVRVGTVSQFGVGEVIPRGMTWHDGELYMIGVGIDANTGDATGTGGLYTLDIATGEATPVATKAQIIGSSGPDTHLSGAASHNGELYVTTTFPGGLHRIDLDTSTSTRIGPDDFGEIDEPYPYGIASHGSPAKLYMIGGRTDKLYTLDTVTGAATGIGDATAFGTVSETQPAELASHGGNLYMTGRSNAWLYTIDTATGAATRVGSANFFGSGESLGFGIATGYTRPADFSIGAATGAIAYTGASAAPGTNVLYAQASDGKAADDTASTAVDDTARVTVTVPNRAPSFSAGSYAYTLAKNSSGSITPAAVGTPPATDPDGHALAYSLRSSDPAERMYMTGGAHDALYALDSTTGAAVRVGATAQFGVSETSPRSLAWHDGQLYMTGYTTNSLYTIDVVTGAASLVATESRIIGDSGGGPTERLSGVASHDGELYVTTMTGSTAGRLYRLDLYTLTGTQIGVDSFGPVGEAHPYAIASNGSPAKLYMIGADTDKLYAIDTGSNGTDSGGNGSNGSGGSAIGTATPVGSSTAFGVGETGPVGLASHGGSLYMIGGSGNQLYTLNTATGAAVPVGSADDFDIGESAAYGIATGYTRPADFTINGTTGAIAYTGASAAPGTSVLYAQASDGRSVTNRSNAAVDDTARVTVTVLNRAPTFSQDSFEFDISNADNTAPGGNGNVNVGTVTAAPGGNVGNAVPGGNGNVNVGTVNAAPVGTVTATDPENDTLAYSLRASDPPNRMYMTGGATSALYTLNSTTGIAARVGHASAFGAGESVPVAMAWHDGRLYMTGSTADALYTLDTATGEAALVATETQITGSGGPARTLSGVASHEGELYVTTTGTGRLYRIDLDTLTGTQIGIDDFTGDDPSFSEDSPRGIASHGSPAKLYMIGAGNDRLYTLDTATGAATAIGGAAGFDLTDASPRGLASHGNSLYMIENTGNRLYTLNTATGAATSVGDATDFGVGESSAYGIATGYTRPADFSIGAATGAIAYTGAVTPDTHILYAQVSDGADPDGDASTAADDTARVTVTFVNQAPAFSQASYKLNILPGTDGSGTAAPVGDATASDPENDTLTYSLRASDPADRMYLVGHTSNALFTLDPATGTAARVGEDTGFGIGVSAVQGMAWHNGRLLLIGSSAGSDDGIFTVDTGTGTVAPLRNMSATGSALDGSTLTGIASHNGSLYLTATGPGRLIKADLRAGTVAQVGSDDFGSAAEGTPAGLASHGSPASLYMVGADNDRLYTLDTTTGAAATVGTAVQFNAPGGGEGTPAGLASHGSPARLYMVGADNDRLYTLDTTTGAAATVGDATAFGVSENNPTGIASGYDKPAVFTVDSSSGTIAYTGAAAVTGTEYTLYTQVTDNRNPDNGLSGAIDDTASVTVRVENTNPSFAQRSYNLTLTANTASDVNANPASDADPSDTLTYSLYPSDPAERMYMTGSTADALYTLDSTTSAAARVGTAAQFGVSETSPRALAWHNGKLYMIGRDTDSIYTLDIITGEATLVVAASQVIGTGTNGRSGHLNGVASHKGELYATTIQTGRLYRVDLETMTGTQIGGDDFGAVNETRPSDITSHGTPAQLYMIGRDTAKLYKVDTTTGAASPVSGTAVGFGTGETNPTGLTSHNGQLYMTGASGNRLYTVDTAAGTAARVGDADDFDTGETLAHGIATGYTQPAGFAIDTATGAITYTGTPYTPGTYTLYVQVSDGKAEDNSNNASIDDIVPMTIVIRPARTAPALPPSQPGDSGNDSGNGSGDDSDDDSADDSDDDSDDDSADDYFTDDDYNTHEANINFIAAVGITKGCSRQQAHYCPHRRVTRAQTTSFIARALKLQPPADASAAAFSDIADSPHRDNIRAVALAGIMPGCDSDGEYFCPQHTVTRAEMASLLARTFNLPTPPQQTANAFRDIADSPHRDSIRAVAAAGVTLGCDSDGEYFCPQHTVTRAEMASLLARALRRS